MMQESLKTAVLIAFILAVLLFVSGFIGYRYGSSKWQRQMAEADRASAIKLAELTESALAKEQALQASMNQLHTQLGKEKNHAQKQIDALRADVRSGTQRLSVLLAGEGGRNASGSDTIAEPGKTRAELDPAFADALVAIAADGDNAIRELNVCIEAYETTDRVVP